MLSFNRWTLGGDQSQAELCEPKPCFRTPRAPRGSRAPSTAIPDGTVCPNSDMTQFTCGDSSLVISLESALVTPQSGPVPTPQLAFSLSGLSFALEKDWVHDLLQRENKKIIFHYF